MVERNLNRIGRQAYPPPPPLSSTGSAPSPAPGPGNDAAFVGVPHPPPAPAPHYPWRRRAGGLPIREMHTPSGMTGLPLRTLVSAILCAAGAALGTADTVPLDQNLVALCADLHLTGEAEPAHQRAGFVRCVQDILACNPRPANAIFYGDLALDHGAPGDYLALKELVRPLEDAGIRWHACLGNHDRRAPFLEAFPDRLPDRPAVPGRLVTVVGTPHADFILLDSCLEGPVHGGTDDAQRKWLQQTLTGATRPVFVGAHHPLKETGVAPLLASCAWCRGYLFGHVHEWARKREEGVETLCLPSTGHWGDIGFVLVKLDAGEAVFTLHQRDYYTPRPAATPAEADPAWRQRTERNQGSQWRVPLGPGPEQGDSRDGSPDSSGNSPGRTASPHPS